MSLPEGENDEPTYGVRLFSHHAQLLRDSAIAPDVAEERGYASVDTKKRLADLGFSKIQQRPDGLLIPLHTVDGEIGLYQFRPDEPREREGKLVKYETPYGSTMRLDVPQRVRDKLGDPSVPLYITEGARKADAAVSAGLCCIALLGVWNWRGKNGRGGKGVELPDWTAIALNDRPVFVIFDSDVVQKRDVRSALRAFAAFLRRKGADVLVGLLPDGENGEKVGLDDYLAAGGDLDAIEYVEPEDLTESDALPDGTLNATDPDLARLTEDAWNLAAAWNDPPVMFRSGGRPVFLEHDDDGRPTLRPITPERLRFVLARACEWVKPSNGDMVATRPPYEVAAQMLATPDVRLPVLQRIVVAPIFAEDGTLELEPGYHERSRTYYEPNGLNVPPIPERPTGEDVAAARALIRDEWLGDFPFRTDADRAHAVALFLLPFVREIVQGATPLHLIDKPTPGTGAGLLADVLLRPSVGGEVGSIPETKDEDELRKALTAAFLENPTALLFDNLTGTLRSAVLNTALTEPLWRARILGGNDFARLPIRVVWVATANNLTLNVDSVRRTVQIRLDARTAQPWRRSTDSFRHPKLREWTDEHRSELVAAALTLVRAWLAAERPRGTGTLGSYDSWSAVVGGVLNVAGIGGFLGNLDEFYETAAAGEDEATLWLLDQWTERFGDREVTASDLWPIVDTDECPLSIYGTSDQQRRANFGRRVIGALRDRQFIVGGVERRVERVGERKRAALWRLTVIPASPSRTTADQHERDRVKRGEAEPTPGDPPIASGHVHVQVEGGTRPEVASPASSASPCRSCGTPDAVHDDAYCAKCAVIRAAIAAVDLGDDTRPILCERCDDADAWSTDNALGRNLCRSCYREVAHEQYRDAGERTE